MRISGPGGALLLTGDIEADSERALLAAGTHLRAEVMQVPHHGSRSSSGEGLLQAVQPALALASAARYSPGAFLRRRCASATVSGDCLAGYRSRWDDSGGFFCRRLASQHPAAANRSALVSCLVWR
ncbi:hypothetical protein O0544_16270 [Edwardsiella anguillarum]|nr:hypothetical protein [Edwardsiella anguillarum]